MSSIDKFYLSQSEPNKSCFMVMRKILLELHPIISETIKYGMPCFCAEDKPFCYLWKDKKTDEPYFLFVKGNLLNHPQLESGTRAKMKSLTVNPNEDLPLEIIHPILKEALHLQLTSKK